MIYKKYKNENYNLYTIKTDKFKSCLMEIVFSKPLDKSKVTIDNFLVENLGYTCKKYPKRKNMVEKLEDLYAASCYSVTTKVGNVLFSNFILEFLDPKYCDKNYLKDVLELPFEMIFNPNITNNEFDIKTFNIIKNRIRASISSLKENVTRYAIQESLKAMDKDSPSSINSIGYLKDLEEIDPETLAEYYNEFLKTCTCDIYIIGNLDMEEVNMLINKYYRNRYLSTDKLNYFVDNKPVRKVKEQIEVGSYTQSTLIQIYNTNTFTEREYNYVIHVFNYIFGNGSLTTKLNKYLREENGMCYSTYSMYQKLDGLFLIYVGTQSKYKDKCSKLIAKALKEMVKGEFTEEDIDYAKKALLSSVKSSQDTPSGLLDNYVFNSKLGTPLLKERAKELQTITKEEIITLAKKIKLNTIYMLKGNENEENWI